MGIATSDYKDPYEPTSIMRCHDGFVAVAEVALEQETDRLIFEALIANICIEIAWPSTYLTAYRNPPGNSWPYQGLINHWSPLSLIKPFFSG